MDNIQNCSFCLKMCSYFSSSDDIQSVITNLYKKSASLVVKGVGVGSVLLQRANSLDLSVKVTVGFVLFTAICVIFDKLEKKKPPTYRPNFNMKGLIERHQDQIRVLYYFQKFCLN